LTNWPDKSLKERSALLRSLYKIISLTAALIISSAALIISSAAQAEANDRHLGPTGMFGKTSPKSIEVTKVLKGSPADGKLYPRDVIVGAGGTLFKENARRELADAIDQAETEASKGILRLTLKGKAEGAPTLGGDDDPADIDPEAELEAEAKGTHTISLHLKALGAYSDTAPYNCAKTDAIITQAADYLVKSGKSASGNLKTGLLGLLATGEQKYIDVVKKTLQVEAWANPDMDTLMDVVKGKKDAGYVGWYWGYWCLTLCEYHLLTGDASVLPAIKAYATAIAMGQDAGGLWGHRMATDARNGRLPGYAQMNQPSLTLFMALLLAEKCGVKHPELTQAITKTHAFYASFIGRGAFNYGVHGPNTRSFNNNGTSGTAALAMAFKGNAKGASFFSRLAATSYDGLETGHATYYFNVLWTPLGASVAGPEVTAQFFGKSRWLHTVYRAWDGSFTFDGSESKAGNSSGSHLLAYCLGRRKLYITGKNADQAIWLKGREATDTIELSNIDYDCKSDEELFALFGHPIPQVTRRAVWTLRSRDHKLVDLIRKVANEGTREQKLSAIGYFGYGYPTEKAVPVLEEIAAIMRETAQHYSVRATAAYALCFHGESALNYYPDMMKLVADDEPVDTFADLHESVGRSLTILCKDPYEAGFVTDKRLFYAAVHKLLDHKRQSARTSGMQMIANIPLEDFHYVADKLLHILEDKDPTYHSYHNQGPRGGAITVLANLNIKEGIDFVLDTLETPTGKWGFKVRMVMSVLPKYGAHAKPALEKLKADPRLKTIEKGRFRGAWQAMVKAIEEDKSPRKLITLEEAKQAGLRTKK
jgi:hypothetical protein